MTSQVVGSGFDTRAFSSYPTRTHYGEKVSYLKTGVSELFYWFRNPAPKGATITSAQLVLTASNTWPAATYTLTAQRVTASWVASSLTWNNKPASTATGQATKVITTPTVGTTLEFDVTAIVQAWASGTPNYGFRITTNSANASQGAGMMNGTLKPFLVVVWSDKPAKPTDLKPSAAATSLAKPYLTFDYLDFGGDTKIAAVQVQLDDVADMATPVFDSGTVATTSAGLDLATTAYAGMSADMTRFWRVRAQDGSGLWSDWSDVVSMTRKTKPTLSITNLGAGKVYEFTPPIIWSTTGQTKYQVLVWKKGSPKTILHNSGQRTGTDSTYTIPAGVLKDGVTFVVEVRSWDNIVREATPGDPTYAFAQAEFVLDYDATVGGCATVTAAQVGVSPWVDVTFTRSTTPDKFTLYRDGQPVRDLVPADVFVSGTTYKVTDYGARPGVAHTYKVLAVVNNKQSSVNPSAVVTVSPSGIWLVDGDRGVNVTLWGDDDGTWTMEDAASVYTPLGSTKVVRIVTGLRGLEGTITGLLMEGFGKTFADLEKDLYAIKSAPTQTVRLILADQNFEALIGNVKVWPKPETRGGVVVKGVSFDFWQVGDLPFDATV